MTDQAGAELIRRYAEANAKDDFETLEALRHPDWQEAWPQSGEIITSNANYRAARTQRPEGAPGVGADADRRLGRLLVGRGDRPLRERLALVGGQHLLSCATA